MHPVAAVDGTLYDEDWYLGDLVPSEYSSAFVPFTPRIGKKDRPRFGALVLELELARTSAERVAAVERALAEKDGRAYLYRAALSVLLDLMRHEYIVKVEKNQLFVSATTLDSWRGSQQEYKEFQRRHLLQERDRQLVTPSVREFLSSMEAPRKWRKRTVSVRSLIADGGAVLSRLRSYAGAQDGGVPRELPIRAYVQEVTPGARDSLTGYKLQDIWRYFRHTWTIPYNSTPGRNIQFLIRDAAQPYHPVVGILGLGSSMIQITARDDYLGWTVEAVLARFAPLVGLPPAAGDDAPSEEEVKAFMAAMRRSLSAARADIRHAGIISRKARASPENIHRLEKRLEKIAEAERIRLPDRVRRSARDESETPLFRKKRAKALLRILKAQANFDELKGHSAVDQLKELLTSSRGRAALGVALQEQKKRLVGSAIMDIVVCGAVPPYGPVLGGKLVAMLATSPTLVNAYRRRYSRAPSEIASAMAGRPIARKADLVFLGTTSLYETHSSQYERIALPRTLGSLRYRCLGKTLGFSSVQFTKETRGLLDEMSERTRGRRVVNYKFGEGVNPKLRQIAVGLADLGLDGDLLRYSSRRLVYGVVLAENARGYLLGEERSARYYWGNRSPQDIERELVHFWTHRWALNRILRREVAESLSSHSVLSVENGLRPWLQQRTLDVYSVEARAPAMQTVPMATPQR